MPKGSSTKGNPAGKRITSTTHKARRERSWFKGESRRRRNAEAQAKREIRNKQLRAEGLPTPWENAVVARLQRRAAERAALPVTGQS